MRNPKTIEKPVMSTKVYRASEVITEIDKTIKDMKTNWDIIRNWNVCDKGKPSKYDLKKVYALNITLEKRIIELKTISICINLGYTSINQLPKDSSFPTIYVRSQLLSRIQNLKTIDTKFNNNTEIVTFNKSFIDKEIKTLNQEVIKCSAELTEFNSKKQLVA